MDEDEPPSKSNRIAPDGDLILRIGTRKSKLQVDSFILSYASKVFCSMLKGPFSEGTRLREAKEKNEPIEIMLPEDNFAAFRTIAMVLHFRQSQIIPSEVAGERLLQVVLAVDKYDLSDAMLHSVHNWLDRATNDLDHFLTWKCRTIKYQEVFSYYPVVDEDEVDQWSCEGEMLKVDRWATLLAAFLSRHRECFETYSRYLTFQHDGSYLGFIKKQYGYYETQLLLAARLTEGRQFAMALLAEWTLDIIRYGEDVNFRCNCEVCTGIASTRLDVTKSKWTHGYGLSISMQHSRPRSTQLNLMMEGPACLADAGSVAGTFWGFRHQLQTIYWGWPDESDWPSQCATRDWLQEEISDEKQHSAKRLQKTLSDQGMCLACFVKLVGHRGGQDVATPHHTFCKEH